MGESVAFDRAAEFYDRTRAMSDESMSRTIELLASELRDRGRVLEVGVGTGLLALPLHEAGIDVAGVDLSPAMIGKLVEKASGTAPFPLVISDATRLPFAAGAFGAAYLRWVLHLIPGWRGVLAEVVRAIGPGGSFLVNLGAYGGPRVEVQERFAELTGIPVRPVGLDWAGWDELDEEMRGHGATIRELPVLVEEVAVSLDEFIEGIEQNRYSWTWRVPEDGRLRAADEIRRWATERFGPVDDAGRFEQAHVWHAYDLP
jgi:SAM-dependent methyltransferase